MSVNSHGELYIDRIDVSECLNIIHIWTLRYWVVMNDIEQNVFITNGL